MPIEHPVVLIRHAIPGKRQNDCEALAALKIDREELFEIASFDGARLSVFGHPKVSRPPWIVCVRFKKQSWIHLIGSDVNLIPIEHVGRINDLQVLATWFEPDANVTQARFYKEGTLAAELTAAGKEEDALEVRAFQSSAHPKSFLKRCNTVRQAVEAFFAALNAQPRELTAVIDGPRAQLKMQDAAGETVDPNTVDELALRYFAPLTPEENPASVALESAITTRDLDGVRRALADGASLEFLPNSTTTPMDLAMSAWHEEDGWPMVDALLEAGAPIEFEWQNPRIFESITPVAYEPYSVATIKKLLELGADINAPTRGEVSETALHRAISHLLPEIVRFLLRNGASLTVRDTGGKTPVERAKELKAIHSSYDPSVLTSPADATDFEPGLFLSPAASESQKPKSNEERSLDLKKRVVRVVTLVEQAAQEREQC